jgi:paraquat-inducible protein B
VKRASPAAIGAFVVGAVVLAVIGVAVFGSGRLFRTTYPYVVYFTGDVNGLKIGAPVKFKGVEIGSVTDIRLNVGAMTTLDSGEEARIPVIIELDAGRMAEKGGKIRLDDPGRLKALIDLGMRAQLSMESFVTGLLYVKLDLHPGSPLRLVADPTVRYEEIPSLPTPLEEVQMRAAEFLKKLEATDLAGLIASFHEAIEGARALLNSPRLQEAIDKLPGTLRKLEDVGDDLEATLTSIRSLSENVRGKIDPIGTNLEATSKSAAETLDTAAEALDEVRAVLQPESPLFYQLNRTLGDVSAAAGAVRRLAEELERNPSVLVRGKQVSKED